MKSWILALFVVCISASAQTIEEKRAAIANTEAPIERRVSKRLRQVNSQIAHLQDELRALYAQVPQLYAEDAGEEDLSYLVEQIRQVKAQIIDVQRRWQEHATADDRVGAYALWHQPWTTIEQLVMDYGADDHVYLIPPEIGNVRLSVASNLPIPRECWGELVEQVLMQNGVGIRRHSPLLYELYLARENYASIVAITADRTELSLYRPTDRVGLVLSPPIMHLRSQQLFLEQFSEKNHTTVMRIGHRLLLLGPVQSIEEMIKLYDFTEPGTDEHHYQMVALSKMDATEMEQIVRLYFDREIDLPYGSLHVHASSDPNNALFLSGAADMVRQAKKLIEGVEAQIANPRETVVYTYTVHHSDAEELACVLSQVYELMREHSGVSTGGKDSTTKIAPPSPAGGKDLDLAVNPAPITTRAAKNKLASSPAKGNFVVSPKTGTLIMVVEQDLLPKLKTLLHKLDVPKRMVKIDVLLFEKRVTDHSRFGLDLLRIGSAASRAKSTGCTYGAPGEEMGIVRFLVSRVKNRWLPSFDFVYDFLMAREDIRINASPSVTTVNNTEAKIDLVEEISIDTGNCTGSDNKRAKQTYSRAQYGIRINITPSVNAADTRWGGGRDTITLDTSVLFDTPRPSNDGRPPVIRRQITNQVRIPDGQTVVLGGLRSRMSEDTQSGLPLLSEIPCFGKIFGSTKSCDRETEMFIFITPTIIEDAGAEMMRLQHEMLARRPGDLPEFLQAVEYARDRRQQIVFERTLEMMFGRGR